MRGYKGTNKDMKCLDQQYEIGKTYHAVGKVELCSNGFHYCKNLRDVFNFYLREEGNRFFEVEADEVETDRKKSVASTLTFVRELSEKEINRCCYGGGTGTGDNNGYGHGNSYGCCDSYGINGGYGDGDEFGDGAGGGYGNGNGNGGGNGGGYGYNITRILKFI
jgi:hypothetical protein